MRWSDSRLPVNISGLESRPPGVGTAGTTVARFKKDRREIRTRVKQVRSWRNDNFPLCCSIEA